MSDVQALKVEIMLILLLLIILFVEFVMVHALITDAFRAGTTALDVLREISGKPT